MRRAGNLLVYGVGLALLFVVSVYATFHLYSSQVPGANDFYPRWKGAQLYWQEGIDPYSDTTSEAIQQGIYGRLAYPDEDQLLFVYPFYTVLVLLPLVWLPLSYSWIQAIWLVIIQFSLMASILLTLRLIEWRMPVWLLGFALVWAVVFYNSARTIILGQFAGLILLWIVGSLLALKQEKDLLAGILLAFTTIKPQMTFLVIPALFIWAFSQRRWRVISGFTLTMILLAGGSFLLLPGWLSGFIEQVSYYPDYTVTPPPLWVITGYYLPQLGKPVETGLSILLMLYLLYQWRRLPYISAVSDELLILIGLTFVVTNMIVVRTATTNYVVLYIPLLWGLKRISDRWSWGSGFVALFFVLSTIAMWALFLNTISGDFEHPIMYLPLPFGLLIMLIWARKVIGRSGRSLSTN
jgi:hypothetical protein